MSVVLPAPSGPTKAVRVPCSTSRETLSSACTTSPPSRRKDLRMSRPSRTGALVVPFTVVSLSPPLPVSPSPGLYSNAQSRACRDATRLQDLLQTHGPHRPDLDAALGSGRLWA